MGVSIPIAWSPGIGEIVMILAIFLLLFGSTKLPKLARSLGSSVTEFKKGLSGKSEDETKKVDPAKDKAESESESDQQS